MQREGAKASRRSRLGFEMRLFQLAGAGCAITLVAAACASDDQSGPGAAGGYGGAVQGGGGTVAGGGTGGSGGGAGNDGGGAAGSAGASGGSAGDGPSCKGTDNPCQDDGECCDGVCVEPPLSGAKLCAATCSKNADCSTGCCYALPIAAKGVCVPPEGSCTLGSPGADAESLDLLFGLSGSDCALPGQDCSGNADCCGYAATPPQSACQDVKDVGSRCAAGCKSGADCKSGCCVPIWGTLVALCLPYDTYCR
jgi:hypothetical protein